MGLLVIEVTSVFASVGGLLDCDGEIIVVLLPSNKGIAIGSFSKEEICSVVLLVVVGDVFCEVAPVGLSRQNLSASKTRLFFLPSVSSSTSFCIILSADFKNISPASWHFSVGTKKSLLAPPGRDMIEKTPAGEKV